MNASQDKLDSVLRKIQALMANAEDASNGPQAQETYRTKAEALMFQYRIEENQLAAQGGANADGIRPVWRTIFTSRPGNEFAQTYLYMAANAVHHVGGKFVSIGKANQDDEGRYWWGIEAVGYESDLRYAELIFTSMQLGFATKMEPKVNPDKTDAENAYVLRSAGLEGRRIAALLWGDDSKPNRVKARKLFAQHAATLGEDPSVLLGRGNSVTAYRDSYASGFQREMGHRLQRMRISTGDSGELVLKGRFEAVVQAFYDKHPDLRPGTSTGRAIGNPRKDCERCGAAKSGYCRQHAYLRPKMSRATGGSFSEAGYARGQVAARHVELGSTGTGRVGRGNAAALHS